MWSSRSERPSSASTPGDRVVGAAAVWCGRCRACRRGLLSACERGATFGHGPLLGDLAGAQADYVRVPFADVTLQPIPAGLSDEQVIFAGDILPTAYSAVAGLAPGGRGLQAGDNVVVFGLGPVGLCAVASAKALRARRGSSWSTWRQTGWPWPAAGRRRRDRRLERGRARLGSRNSPTAGAPTTWSRPWASRRPSANAVAVAAPGRSRLGGGRLPAARLGQRSPHAGQERESHVMGMGDLGRMRELVGLIEAGRLDVTPLVTHR